MSNLPEKVTNAELAKQLKALNDRLDSQDNLLKEKEEEISILKNKAGTDPSEFPKERVGTEGEVSFYEGKLVTQVSMKPYINKDGEKVLIDKVRSRGGRIEHEDQKICLIFEDGEQRFIKYVDWIEFREKRKVKLITKKGDISQIDQRLIENENMYFVCEIDGKQKDIHISAFNS